MKPEVLIAHTTALADDDIAWVHAVALAAYGGARLASVHARAGTLPEPELPLARELLRRWGLPEQRVEHERIVHECCDDVENTLLDALRRLQPDLIVTATHARTGVGRWLSGSVAESVARNSAVPTLLLPIAGSCFVDRETGRVNLERILVPAGSDEEARQGVDAAVRLAQLAGVLHSELVLIHVADGRAMPASPQLPAGFSLLRRASTGPLEATLVQLSRELGACLVAMATHGHDGLSDVILGSHTERVLHEVGRPLLWVPISSPVTRA